MFVQLTQFELQKALHKRTNLIYFGVLFSLAFVVVHAAAGFFDFFKIMLVGETMHLNGASLIEGFLSFFRVFVIFVVAASVSSIVFVDYKYNTLSMTFTTGVSKFNFIISKLIAAFITAVFIMSGAVFGHVLACAMPYLDASYFTDFHVMYYISPFLKNYSLNIFIMISVFMAFTMLFRSSLINWILVIIFYGLNIVSAFYFKDIDTSITAAMIDPTGALAAKLQMHGLSAENLDHYTVQLQGVYLYNRLMWFAIAVLSIVLLFFKFDFQYQLSFFKSKKKTDNNKVKEQQKADLFQIHQLKTIKDTVAKASTFSLWWRNFVMEFKFITLSVHFILTLIIGVGVLIMTSSSTGNMYETASYPVTFEMVELISNTFSTLLTIFIILIAGELVWRERAAKCNEINDALPISSFVPMSSKISALIIAITAFLLLFILAGVFIQYSKDFHDYQIGQYLISIFAFDFVDFALFTVLAFFVHILVNNKYLSFMLLIVYYFAGVFGANLFEHKLLSFSAAPDVIYSDLNAYGNNVLSYAVFKFYWFTFALILLMLAKSLWIRGEVLPIKKRLLLAKNQLLQFKLTLVGLCFVFLITGSYIFYNTNILNQYKSSHVQEKQQVAYEKKYKQYQDIVSPEIMDIKVHIDIFPESQKASGHVIMQLTNTSDKAIEQIHLSYKKRLTHSVVLSAASELISNDDEQGYYIYQLNQPLKVNQSMELVFDFEIVQHGFSNLGGTTSINKNGTFINSSQFFPSFGYNASKEILSKRTRIKYNLADKPLALKRDDKHGLRASLFGENSHFTNTDVTISTSSEQMAFSSGNLINQWQKEGRNFYHYKNKAKVQNFIPFVSGDYAVKKVTWQDKEKQFKPVEISVNYYKSHAYNIDKILQSAKDSLDYYSHHFSAFAQEQLRIIEFPRTYGSFAQSFPSTVPFSETIGFLTDLRELDKDNIPFEEQKIDVAYFVTAHEIAHQWWAHQVSSAHVEGMSFLIESMSEYSALKVMEKRYGKQKIKKFLRTERQKYLLSRGMETYEERPLATSLPSQQATVYNKGSLSLYALDNFIGTDVFDKTIQEFIQKYAYKSNPYPTSKDFVDLLMQNSPQEMQQFIDDELNKITLYEVKLLEASYQRDENLHYQAKIKLNIHKFYSDTKGKETQVQMNDIIEIGIYNSKEKELLLKKVYLNSGENKITLELDRKPKTIIIDPYYHIMTKGFEIEKRDFVKE